jgi:peptidoglycan/LPS O-acetylase OafA/YrhL
VTLRAGAKPNVRNRPVHWPALDGVRALAVAAVVVYHAHPGWLPGGFMGVDVFFVLSGFLITSLLLREQRGTGRIGLRAFWLRRARRLLPALYVLLAVALTYELAVHLAGAAQLRWDALAALGYATNWFLIGHQQSYFAAFSAPDALQHLWSLAVEEQFYLVWPLLCVAGLLRRRGVLVVIAAAAAGSTLLCAFLYSPLGDPSRVYYGTDTHSAGLLIGAALALLHANAWPRVKRNHRTSRRAVLMGSALGSAGLGLLLCGFALLGETQALVYRGGLSVMALGAALLIGVLLHPAGGVVARVFAWRPLRWVGVRSYGIYLWHWPVLVGTSPHGDPGSAPLTLTLVQVAAAVGLAALSYRFVETPVRSGAATRWVRALWARNAQRHVAVRLSWGALGGAVAGGVCALLVAVAAAHPPTPPSYQRTVAVHLTTGAFVVSSLPSSFLPSAPTPADTPQASPTAIPSPPPPPAPPPHVTAVGDSVMLGAAGALAADVPNLTLDAKVGRQMSETLSILRGDRDAGRLGQVVVVHMGTNGFLTRDQFDQMMQILTGVPRVVVLNDKVPRPWQDPNDTLLAQAAAAYPAVVLIDWRAASTPHPEIFWDDDTHLRPEGARFYASLIASHLVMPAPVASAPVTEEVIGRFSPARTLV